jgi:hypothetical protein
VTDRRGADPSAREQRNRMLEVFTVVVLGVATVSSAWCAFQSSQWNDQFNIEARAASDAKVEQARLFALGTQLVMYDTTVLSSYAAALAEERPQLTAFIRESMVRPEFLPILDDWEAQVTSGSAEVDSLLENAAYQEPLFAPAADAERAAIEATARASEADSHSDAYLMTTLLMASALFLGGVVSSFRARPAQVLLLSGAVVMLALGAARIVDLPVAA